MRKLSVNQKQHLRRFELAKEYGRRVKSDPELMAEYRDPLRRMRKKNRRIGIYQLAIKDFMNPPTIFGIRKEAPSKGEVIIHIEAWDLIRITRAGLSLVSQRGGVLEEGSMDVPDQFANFSYKVGNPAVLTPGVMVHVKIWDLPGNLVEKDFPWPS